MACVRAALAIVVVALCRFHLRADALDASGVCKDCSGELSRAIVCDPTLWKTGKDLPGFVDTLMVAWCNATAQDATKHARIAEEELQSCNHSKRHCSNVLKACEQEKIKHHMSCEEEKFSVEAKFSAAQEESLAQVAYWKEKCQSRISIAECNYQKQAAVSKCRMQSQAELSPIEDLQTDVVCSERVEVYHAKLKAVEESLASCRLQKAYVDATSQHSSDEALVKKLKEQIQRLYRILAICGALFFGMIPAIVFLHLTKRGEKQVDSSTQPKSLQVLTPTQTLRGLESMYEGGTGTVRPLLTSLVVEGREQFILLVPFNCYRKRKFALFGDSGDYCSETEFLRTIGNGAGAGFIVLYDHSGHAFSESLLRELKMLPKEIAERSVPKDRDYPTRLDIGVLWVNSMQVVLTNADGISMFPNVLEEQVWVHYLGR